MVNASFSKVIVLIDSANAMQMNFVNAAEYGVDAVLWYAARMKEFAKHCISLTAANIAIKKT